MYKNRITKSIFYKLFLSYLVIFIIPIAVLTTFLYKTTVLDVQKEIESSNTLKLTQLKDSLDLRMKELEHQALKINLDPKLTPYSMTSTYYKQMEGIEKLGIYKANNAFTEELMIYYRNYDTIFSPFGSCYLSTLTKYIYILDEKKEKQFNGDLNNIKIPTIKPAERINLNGQNMELLTYMYPITRITSDPYAVVIFFIKKDVFEDMIKNILGDLPGSVFITDKSKNVLVSTNNKRFDILKQQPDFLTKDYPEGLYHANLQGKNLAVISVKSDYTNWMFTSVIENSYLYKKAAYMRTIIGVIVLGVFTFGIFVIIIMASKNYEPVKNLLKTINGYLVAGEREKYMDEFELINHTVASAINQNQDLREEVNSQKPLIKGQLLSRLLLEKIKDKDSLEKQLKHLQINLSGPFYAVAVMEIIESEGTYRDNIFVLLKEHFDVENSSYVIDFLHDKSIAIIMNLKDKDETKEYQKNHARNIKDIVESRIGTECVIGIGTVGSSIEHLNHSFIEAKAALNYSFLKGLERIIFFENIISSEKQVYWYPAANQLRFIQSLKQGSKILASDTLNEMMNDIDKSEADQTIIKYVCYDIINMLIKAVNELGISGVDKDIERLMKFSSLKDLRTKLICFCDKLCDLVDDRKKNKDEGLYKNIMEYIDSNYEKYDLSLEGLADKFQLPAYHLSRFLKEQSGYTFTEYVTKLRMERAKLFLSNSAKPIKEIVAEVGYTDLTNFMRRFKQIEGITPGQYRKINASENNNENTSQ
jgi:YesN/AraC family two-component response regulator